MTNEDINNQARERAFIKMRAVDQLTAAALFAANFGIDRESFLDVAGKIFDNVSTELIRATDREACQILEGLVLVDPVSEAPSSPAASPDPAPER